MLLSQYLLDKNLLSVEQVLEVMLEQLRLVPSLPEVLYELNILTKNDLLQIIIRQQLLGKDFLTCSYELGIMKQDILEKLFQKISSKQRAFSEIVLEKGFITTETLSKEVVNYSEYLLNNQGKDNSLKQNAEQKPQQTDSKSITNETVQSTKSQPMIVEYINCFEQSFQPNMLKICEKYVNDHVPVANNTDELKKLQGEFTAIKAAASFINAKVAESIATDCAKYISCLIANKTEFNKDKLIKLMQISNEILSILCQSIKKEGREADSDNLLKDKILVLYEIIGQNLQ